MTIFTKNLFGIFICLTMMLSCASIDYIGQSYPETEKADLYFSEDDVEVEYKVIGKIIATADADDLFYSNEKLTNEIVKKARQKGGDGIIILDFNRVQTGTTVSRERTETIKDDRNKTVIQESENQSSEISEKRRVTALVVKYKTK